MTIAIGKRHKHEKNFNMRRLFFIMFIAMVLPSGIMAQYPQLTEEAKEKINELEKQWKAHSDSAWAIAEPIVMKESKEGRPYVPWASRPYDLPQAKIPAFPGAEGGGMYAIGGRGGKVLTVTNLNDDGPGSFRWACEQGGARIVVFKAGGESSFRNIYAASGQFVLLIYQTDIKALVCHHFIQVFGSFSGACKDNAAPVLCCESFKILTKNAYRPAPC